MALSARFVVYTMRRVVVERNGACNWPRPLRPALLGRPQGKVCVQHLRFPVDAFQQSCMHKIKQVCMHFAAKLGVDLKSLNIITGKTCWVVYVDAVILNDAGNVLDALSYAALAALANTRIPRVEIVAGEDGDEPEIELDDDMSNSILLDVSNVPVIVSVSQVCQAESPNDSERIINL